MPADPQPSPPPTMDFAAALSRRKWHQHWYRPGNDTPLGYYMGRFVFLALLVAGLPTAVLGRGWHVSGDYLMVAVVDGTWVTTKLIGKYRKGRRLPLGPGARGELWIDTPESRTGIPLDEGLFDAALGVPGDLPDPGSASAGRPVRPARMDGLSSRGRGFSNRP